MLSPEEMKRYQRQTILPEIGTTGQEKLKAARVLVVGAGGLGCPVLLYLTAAGVGTLGLVDADRVSESNLHRQVLYQVGDVGKLKVTVAAERLRQQNPFVQLHAHPFHLNRDNALSLLRNYDLVVDCTDNFPARYLINDACAILQKPFVYAAIHRFEGQVAVFNALLADGQRSATYRCLFPQPPPPDQIPDCNQAGVLGVLPGLIGLYQANEVIKMITGAGHVLAGELLILELLSMQTRTMRLRRRPEADQITQLIDYEAFCNGNHPDEVQEISAEELHEKLVAGENWLLLDVRETDEYEICHLPGSRLIPMGQVAQQSSHIPTDQPVAVYCHHGMRSAWVIRQLQQRGYRNLYNLAGGIDAWAREVDETMPLY